MKLLDDSIDKFENQIDDILISKTKRKKLQDGFKNNKTINEVLDKTTILELYNMISSNIISYVNGAVKSGKESLVFWAVDKNKKDIALKIFLISTSNFKRRMPYLVGDSRFSRIKKGTRNLVYLWAQKEFKNLQRCFNHDIPVVRPIHVTKNILAMEFVGKNGVPEKTLVESNVTQNDYNSAISLLINLYKKAHLVHGDFSEYNIFKTKTGLVLLDLASAVDLEHPNANDFLKRDINNISNFFVKRGFTVEHPSDIFSRVTK